MPPIKIPKNYLVKLFYKERRSLKECAKIIGVSVGGILKARYRYGLPYRGLAKPTQYWLGKKRSPETIRKMLKNRKKLIGPYNHQWKGGQYIQGDGYRMILNRKRKIYILEHRSVMEDYLQRRLRRSEVVHHVNGDKLDNRIENLELLSHAEHGRRHQPKGSYFGVHSHKITEINM